MIRRFLLTSILALSLTPASFAASTWRQGANRIYGGEDVQRGQYPFMAAVILDEVALCGGSLISSTTVLTAARCVMGFQSIWVHLGAHNLTDAYEEGRVRVQVSRTVAHEDFDSVSLDHDLGLLKMPISIDATNISPIEMPDRSFVENNTFVGYTGRIFGWGLTKNSDLEYGGVLQTTESIVITNEECDDLYVLFESYVTPSKMCLDNYGESGGCQGDLGGPAVVVHPESGRLVQVGIVSFSAGKCGHALPLLLIRLSEYLDWIQENAGIVIE